MPDASTSLPAVGQPLPDFSLLGTDGATHAVADLVRDHRGLVLFYFPKANTDGWTLEAVAFRDLKADFDRLGYAVVGISPDPIPPLLKFRENNSLPFLFLSDEGAKTATNHGVWVEKSMYGKTYMGVARSTFVTDENGVVEAVYFNVKPQGHAEFVRDAIEHGGE